MKATHGITDRRLMLIFGGSIVLLIAVVSMLAPASSNDPRPVVSNNGPLGAKAAFLLLQQIGRNPLRWNQALDALDNVDAAKSTLILASPQYDPTSMKELAGHIRKFLERGGRVIATEAPGAHLLPGGSIRPPGLVHTDECFTTPEGPGPLARAGEVKIDNYAGWSATGPQYAVEQRCGNDAVVVRYAVGKGEAIWWSSALPLTNDALKIDGDLRLLLASIGDDRQPLFDEALHTAAGGLWGKARGLPVLWLELQTAIAALLLIFSFSRRSGPIRAPLMKPRSSPLEFADSMGDLYAKAGATSAATEAARRRLLRMLMREAGIARAAVERGPDAIADALEMRLGGDWSLVAKHLRDAKEAEHTELSPRSALRLVKAMDQDAERVRATMHPQANAVVV